MRLSPCIIRFLLLVNVIPSTLSYTLRFILYFLCVGRYRNAKGHLLVWRTVFFELLAFGFIAKFRIEGFDRELRMRDKADVAGSPRFHGMLLRPFMQRQHQRATEPIFAVLLENDEASELVIVLAFRYHASDSADRFQGGDEAEEKVGRGFVLLVYFGLQRKALLVSEHGNPHVETLLLELVAAWRAEVGYLDDLVSGS